jgi:YgiT-type zinc finger domain-containing protein
MTPGRMTMKCDICGKPGAKLRRATRTYGKGKQLFVIENIPVVSCPSCGESYLTADTLHEIERLRRHQKTLGVTRSVKSVAYA